MDYARMVRQFGEKRLQDFSTLALVGESLVGFRRGYIKREGMKDGCLVVIGILLLKRRHLCFVSLLVTVHWLRFIDFAQCIEIRTLARGGLRIGGSNLVGVAQGFTASLQIAVLPE